MRRAWLVVLVGCGPGYVKLEPARVASVAIGVAARDACLRPTTQLSARVTYSDHTVLLGRIVDRLRRHGVLDVVGARWRQRRSGSSGDRGPDGRPGRAGTVTTRAEDVAQVFAAELAAGWRIVTD